MPYTGAGINIHKKVLLVVSAGAADEVRADAGEALEFEGRRFGTGAAERQHQVSWLQERKVTEAVMESRRSTGSRCGWIRSRIWGSCTLRRRTPIVRGKGARRTLPMPNG
jgi:hypothetical protein